jgi:hypothetical protein
LARFSCSFQPLLNPLGFGAGDFIELTFAALLVLLVLARARIEPSARKFAERTGWCMLLLAALPVALRLLLIPQRAIPSPGGADDFSYLLLADTLSHFRLANPPHPLRQFFEAIFVLQEPTYSSIFPLGQGIVLAIGRAVFGHPWAGVALSVAAFCSLCYWMLRAWTTPGWALVGGALAALEFGPLNQWMNTYWGGAFSATAGCLVFGALPRLRQGGRPLDAVLLGTGLGLQLLTRPYEFVLLVFSVLLFLTPALRERKEWRKLARAAQVAALMVVPAVALTLLQNRAVTGSWTTLPYQLSRYQYGVPATFTVQPNPVPHRALTAQQKLDYEMQSAVHGDNTDSFGSYFQRLGYRLRFYRFFFLAPLYVALPAFLLRIREFRFAWLSVVLLVFALGANFYPYFYSHYVAAVACLFVLISVTALERVSRLRIRGYPAGEEASRLIVVLCAGHFLFWYGLHLFGNDETTQALARYESWDFINYGDPEGRIEIDNRLAQVPGKQLVFVRYSLRHVFREWVHNAAEIDSARVVCAGDLGAAENEKLRRYYPDRAVWLLEPDARPPKLSRYEPERVIQQAEPKKPESKNPEAKKSILKFEEIPEAPVPK